MKNAWLSLVLLGSTTLFSQTEVEQAFTEELGPQVARTLVLNNCNSETNDLIFNRMMFQPEYSYEFIERGQAQGLNSAFYQKYAQEEIPENGQLEYQSVARPYQLILMDDEHGYMAFRTIEFSTTKTTTEICVDQYWYKTNTRSLVDQLQAGELEELRIHVYLFDRENPIKQHIAQSWTLSKSGTQVSLTVEAADETVQEHVTTNAFLQGLKDWEDRVRMLPEHHTNKKQQGQVEAYQLGDAHFAMYFSTRNTAAFESDNLQALLELL